MWVCRWRNHALFWSIVFTVTLRTCTWSSVLISQISDRLTCCSTACPGWDQKKHRNSIIRDVIICNIEIVFRALFLQWHNMSVTTFQTLSRLTVFQQYALAYSKGNIRTLTGDVVICKTEMALLLQWRHMSVLMFPITSRSTVCSIACHG